MNRFTISFHYKPLIKLIRIQAKVMQKLELKDLFSALAPQQEQQQFKQVASQPNNATQQFLATPSQEIKSLPLKEQLRIKRESTYRSTQQQGDKWIGIIKLNRQKDTLNLVKKDKDNAASINFFPSAPISTLQEKIEGKLQQLELHSQQTIMKKEEEALAKLPKEQAQSRLREARRRRTAQFNEQIKRRRMAKIKSKLYRKIKKRQKMRDQAKRIGELEGEERKQYMQKIAKQRIKERITLRHRSKSQHIQSLLRFSKNNKQAIQDSINEINAIRHQQLQKLNEEFREDSSQLGDIDPNAHLEQLQQEIDRMQNQAQAKPKGLDAMKFMQIGRQKELQAQKEELQAISHLIEEQGAISQQEQQQNQQKQIMRKTFGQAPKKTKQIKAMGNYIQRNLKNALAGDKGLTEGINVDKLKDKYQPQRAQIDLTQAIQLHKEAFAGQNDIVEENYREFEKQKYVDYEAQLAPQKKQLKGWGGWAGPGISEPKVDHAAQVRKKLAKIEQIKRKRRDGEMAGIIIRETYNKQLKDYFVSKLPHNMKSPEQFDYMQSEAVGPEWNTLTQFKANVQPKVVTKAGQVIEPIKMPKRLEKGKK